MTAGVPPLLYGTAWKEEQTAALVELAVRTGFRGIDTANQRRHYVESAVGDALAAAIRSGVVERTDVFVQTKFTYRRGQDHRLPYDPGAPLAQQVSQSLASSLTHLRTTYVDSLLLHGPASPAGWSSEDAEAWAAIAREREAGRALRIGVSNVTIRHLEQMVTSGAELPTFVQNRCFASAGWDRDVRAFCRGRGIIYQGFSLLTANRDVLQHRTVVDIATAARVTPAQVVFAFARAVGMVALTGTSDVEHMRQDLASERLELAAQQVAAIEKMGSG